MATKKKVANGKNERRMKLHGRYVGLVAHAGSERKKAKAKRIYAEKGPRAAIVFLTGKE